MQSPRAPGSSSKGSWFCPPHWERSCWNGNCDWKLFLSLVRSLIPKALSRLPQCISPWVSTWLHTVCNPSLFHRVKVFITPQKRHSSRRVYLYLYPGQPRPQVEHIRSTPEAWLPAGLSHSPQGPWVRVREIQPGPACETFRAKGV